MGGRRGREAGVGVGGGVFLTGARGQNGSRRTTEEIGGFWRQSSKPDAHRVMGESCLVTLRNLGLLGCIS